jgi:hypothetical protein
MSYILLDNPVWSGTNATGKNNEADRVRDIFMHENGAFMEFQD